jgi:hypothetical protein
MATPPLKVLQGGAQPDSPSIPLYGMIDMPANQEVHDLLVSVITFLEDLGPEGRTGGLDLLRGGMARIATTSPEIFDPRVRAEILSDLEEFCHEEGIEPYTDEELNALVLADVHARLRLAAAVLVNELGIDPVEALTRVTSAFPQARA